MPSITSWTRIEPRTRSEDLRGGLQAQIHDPLWMLARQWQLGEFAGEDAGSPVVARLRAQCARLSRYHAGPMPDGPSQGQPYRDATLPLETLVEREAVSSTSGGRSDRRLAAEAGLQFLRLLDAAGVPGYSQDYLARYPFEPPSAGGQAAFDSDSLRFLRVMAHRVPDGAQLYEDLGELPRQDDGTPTELPEQPAIAPADRAAVLATAGRWLDWYETLFSEPAETESSWLPERLEYGFAVSARTADGELVLGATEYAEGHLDWYSFDLHPGASLGTDDSDLEPQSIVRTAIPAPVAYRGMPVSRWWEFEDAQVDFGGIEAGPEDLARMIFVQFALVYGNDWFVLPVELPVGSVCRTSSLVVTDTFGERTLIRPYSEVDPADSGWRMFSLDHKAGPAADGPPEEVFFLPPTLAHSLHSSPVEEVLFLRDELANMAWAVERIVQGQAGRAVNRFEAYQEQRQRQEAEATPTPTESTAPLTYRLATGVPDHWIPLVPEQEDAAGSIRLRRGRMLLGGTQEQSEPQGLILEPGRELSLFEEEVPRAGARVQRAYQYARWTDGSTHLWVGRRKRPGAGEGWSGLRFDVVEPTSGS